MHARAIRLREREVDIGSGRGPDLTVVGVVELERRPKLDALRARFVERGVWVRPFGNVVYLMPPFVIGAEDLATLTAAVQRAVAEAAAAGDL